MFSRSSLVTEPLIGLTGLCKSSALSRAYLSYCAAAIVGAVFPGGFTEVASAQDMILEGRVTESATGQPLPAATVVLLDTGSSVQTSRWGVYRIVTESARAVNVRLVLSGYATVVERVTLTGTRTIADFKMSPVDAVLDALTVSEPNLDTRESEGGFAVRTVDLLEFEDSEAGDLLKDIPGVLILQPSGQVGSGAKVQLRGIRSLFSGNDPLIFVDGVRMADSHSHVDWARGESALDYLPASQIERIEVLKGPAATARFGTGALNGVIHIFTKKGPRRTPR